jgi:lysophospholipase L1-like esterase
MSAAPAHRRGIALLAIVLLCALPFLMIAGAEAAGRFYIWLEHGVPGHTYGIYTYDPVLKGILAPMSYNTADKIFNNQGFQRIQDSAVERPKDTVRVIAYGGSTTFCYNLPTGKDWPMLLEKFAGIDGRKIEMLNAGDVSWTLSQALARSRKDVPRYKPDIIIFYEGLNEESNFDALTAEGIDMAAEVAAGHFGLFTTRLPQDNWFFRNSLVAKAFMSGASPLAKFLSPPPSPPDSEISTALKPLVLANFRGTLAKAIDEWQAGGAKVIYVIQAHGKIKRTLERLMEYSPAAADIARDKGAIVVDARQVVRDYKGDITDLFIDTGVHWSEKGAPLMAQFVYDRVKDADGWKPTH